MMNNKGFTLIELMVSVILISIVLVFMFNLLGDIKRESALSNEDISDNLDRATITRIIQNDFIESKLTTISICNDSDTILCYNFTFQDNSSKKLLVREKEIEYDNERWILDYGKYSTNGNIYCTSNIGNYYYLKILIPVIDHPTDNRIHNIELIRISKNPLNASGSNAC